ncbi:MAG: hypothetical protein K2X01_10690 [Cyanobacteria bacterium]|nr:hypothetical protein [Cyanobacteriota bacterium]
MTIASTPKPTIRYPAIRFGQMATGNLMPPGSGKLPSTVKKPLPTSLPHFTVVHSNATSDKSATSLWQDLFALTPHRKKIIWLTFLSFLALC